jgi:hypothetical protein
MTGDEFGTYLVSLALLVTWLGCRLRDRLVGSDSPTVESFVDNWWSQTGD